MKQKQKNKIKREWAEQCNCITHDCITWCKYYIAKGKNAGIYNENWNKQKYGRK